MDVSGFCQLDTQPPITRRRKDAMRMNWEKVLSRLSVPGLTLLVLGVLTSAQAAKLCRLVFKERGERAILPVRITGLVLALLGAAILLDLIPGL